MGLGIYYLYSWFTETEMTQLVKGYVYDDAGNEVLVEGEFVGRTDDPEEYIQDVVIRTSEGRYVYIDEQNVVW